MKLEVLCEYMEHPGPLDAKRPRFSWYSNDILENTRQNTYRIEVKKGDTIVWDSKTVYSSRSSDISYEGAPLETAQEYTVTVEVDYSNGIHAISDPLKFSTALMGEDQEWRAPWIGCHHIGKYTYWYRKEFSLLKKTAKVTAFVLSSCYYVLTVNGKKADDTVLNNATSDYEKTLYYATYDLTDKVNVLSENALGVTVGMGWQNLRMSEDGVGCEENSFSLQLRIQYEDGEVEWIFSDLNGWYYTFDGPLVYNSLYNGEIYDARLEITGFDCPGFKMNETWHKVVEHESPGGRVKSQNLEPIRIVEERSPVRIYELEDGSYTLDYGQNFAGWVRLKIKGEKGQKVTLQYAELEYDDHSVNVLSLRSAKARDAYILKGEEEECYEPSFTFHGFRYVQIFGLTQKPDPEQFTGCVVRSDVKRIGWFESSNKLLDQIYSNIIWTESSNLHSVPTDCPQRDERLGWLNDMTVRNECAIYNYRLLQLYEKWVQDIRDTQGKVTGAITDTAPFRRYGSRPGDSVSGSFLLVPWNIYLHYGDRKILEENFEPIKRWVNFLIRNSDDYVMRYSQMGDWAGPIGGTDHDSDGGGAISAITPTVLMGSGFLYYDAKILSKMANILGKKEDGEYYEEISKKTADAFLREFYHADTHSFALNSQASNTFPMYLDIVPEKDRTFVLKNIVEDIRAHGTHLTTGNLCSRYIIEVLMRNGEADLAYEILTSTEYPGWGYMVANGATTIWERWEKVVEEGKEAEMASYNHPMNGAVGVAFSKHLAGILVDETSAAFERFVIKPVLPKKLEHVSFTYQSVKGKIVSSWKQSETSVELEVVIPLNTEATVYVPVKNKEHFRIFVNGCEADVTDQEITEDGYAVFSLGSGRYLFKATEE